MARQGPVASAATPVMVSRPSVTFLRSSGSGVTALSILSPGCASCRLKSKATPPAATRWRRSSMRKSVPLALASSSLRPWVPPTGSKIHLPNCFWPAALTKPKPCTPQ